MARCLPDDMDAARLQNRKSFLIGTFVLLALLCLVIPSRSSAEDDEIDHIYYANEGHLKATVFKIIEPDVLRLRELAGMHFFSCVLYGVDAPEVSRYRRKTQPYAREAMLHLSKQVYGEVVDIELTGRKIKGRHVCKVEKDGMNINLDMIRNGYAWAYTRYMKKEDKKVYLSAEKEARAKRLGLWEETRPTPPWKFRRKLKEKN